MKFEELSENHKSSLMRVAILLVERGELDGLDAILTSFPHLLDRMNTPTAMPLLDYAAMYGSFSVVLMLLENGHLTFNNISNPKDFEKNLLSRCSESENAQIILKKWVIYNVLNDVGEKFEEIKKTGAV